MANYVAFLYKKRLAALWSNQKEDGPLGVVPEPPPQVFFGVYGDSSLDFTILVHLQTPSDRIPATHELNSATFEAFREHGIQIPFPQRDLHLCSIDESAASKLHLSENQALTLSQEISRVRKSNKLLPPS